MAKPLVVVDSEAKARTIQAQFDGDLDTLLVKAPPVKVTCLPPKDALKKEAPQFSFSPLESEKDFLSSLRNAVDGDIYLALENDQRGEYWSWMINEFLLSATNGGKMAHRLNLTGLSHDTVRDSFHLVEPVQNDKATAYYIRMMFNSYLVRHLKRLIGTTTGPQGLPLHSNSLTTLFLLAERESEIRMFTPSLKWQVLVRLSTGKGEVEARLEEAYGITDDGFVKDAAEAKKAVDLFKDNAFQVNEIERSDFVIQPPAPYRIAELLEDAYTLHHLTPRQTLEAVFKLFHGVVVDGVPTGLVSSFLPLENVELRKIFESVREQAGSLFGEQALAEKQDPEQVSGMIVPLRPEIAAESLSGTLQDAEQEVYALICGRAMASQMKPASGEILDVEFTAGEECFFKTSTRFVTDKGFLAAYHGFQHRELVKPCPLADITEGGEIKNLQIIPEQTGGFPPEYYTFEELAADLADFSITLDATTIIMLQSMIDGGYLALMADGSLRCKENATKLLNVMNRAFPSMQGINLSAYFEQTVTEVVSGRKPFAFALKQFDQTLMMQGNVLVKVKLPTSGVQLRARKSRSIIKAPDEIAPSTVTPPAESTPPSPHEGKPPEELVSEATEEELTEMPPPVEEGAPEPVVEEASPGGGIEEPAAPEEGVPPAALGPEAEGTAGAPGVEEELTVEPETVELTEPVGQEAEAREVFDKAPVEEEVAPEEMVIPAASQTATADLAGRVPAKVCPDCGRPLLLKEDRFGKYWYCSGHPGCRHSESYEKETGPGMNCPLCDIGNIITKHTPTGKLFYVCPEQDCEFMAWSRPHPLTCQVCNSPFLVEKRTLAGKTYLRCPRAGCNYMQPLPGDGDIEGLLSPPAAKKKKKVRVRRVARGAAGGKRKVRVVRRKK